MAFLATPLPHTVPPARTWRLQRFKVLRAHSTPSNSRMPWVIEWQVNERHLSWTRYDDVTMKKQLVRNQAGWPPAEFDSKWQTLTAVLPDVEGYVLQLPVDTLADMLDNPALVAQQLIHLKRLLPGSNVASMILRYPKLLTLTAAEIQAAVEKLQQLLARQDVGVVVEEYPKLLNSAAVDAGLAELARLVPKFSVEAFRNQLPNLLGTMVERTDATLGPSAAWDADTESWRD